MAKIDSKKSTTKKEAKEEKKPSLIAENSVIKIVIPIKSAKEAYQKILNKLARTVSAEGFRKGKVPNNIAEQKIGIPKLIEETLQDILPNLYSQEITKQKKQPLTHPEFKPLSLTWEKDWEIEAYFPEPCTVKLSGYKEIVKKAKISAKKESKEDIKEGSKKDKKDEKLTQEQQKEKDLQYIFRDLVINLKPAVAELLLRYETKAEYDKLKANLTQINLTVDQYMQKRQLDEKQLTNELATSALSRLQLDFILGAIAKEEKIAVTKIDIDNYLKKLKDQSAAANLKKDPQYLSYLEAALIKQKVVEHLLDI